MHNHLLSFSHQTVYSLCYIRIETLLHSSLYPQQRQEQNGRSIQFLEWNWVNQKVKKNIYKNKLFLSLQKYSLLFCVLLVQGLLCCLKIHLKPNIQILVSPLKWSRALREIVESKVEAEKNKNRTPNVLWWQNVRKYSKNDGACQKIHYSDGI